MSAGRKISVLGLGYAGLPVAVAFGKKSLVLGFDIDQNRIEQLTKFHDQTNEVTTSELKNSKINFTHNPEDLSVADFHIVAVPTPVDEAHTPDLSHLYKASEIVGKILKPGDIVVYESTVYPGATEEQCIPRLEKSSNLKNGQDFFVGYSPERINPADAEHSFTNITKVVSGQDPKTCEIIAAVYGDVIDSPIHCAPSIKVAEAAKVIENTQRDLNIALMNELAIIFGKMGIDTTAVLEAASTKWNFLPFTPGLVGGHCIGVDPYYLTYKAECLGYRPEVILAGRRINDGMGKYIASKTIKRLINAGCHIKGTKIAVLGLTFKENCSDIRNSRVIDIINELNTYSVEVLIHDPIANKAQAKQEYGLDLIGWDAVCDVDAIILCVAHKQFLQISPSEYAQKFSGARVLADVKAVLDKQAFEQQDIDLWRL